MQALYFAVNRGLLDSPLEMQTKTAPEGSAASPAVACGTPEIQR
jgi:hypothetical protein